MAAFFAHTISTTIVPNLYLRELIENLGKIEAKVFQTLNIEEWLTSRSAGFKRLQRANDSY